jgi:hypothetical protein
MAHNSSDKKKPSGESGGFYYMKPADYILVLLIGFILGVVCAVALRSCVCITV